MCLQYEKEALARWTPEMNALGFFGVTTGDFTLVFDSDPHPELAQDVFCTSLQTEVTLNRM